MFNHSLTHSPEIMLTIRNRSLIVYQGSVKAVTSMNVKGRFDVLAEHANFISLIKDYIIIHKTDGSEQEIKLTKGVLKVDGNNVSIYLGVSPDVPVQKNIPPVLKK